MSNANYILIENPGIAPVESFTLLGASNKAGTDAIGQFGSGTKFGVLTLLRKGIYPIIYSGNLRIEFGTKDIQFDGGDHKQVFAKLSGKDQSGKTVKRTEDLSIVLNYGKIDWKDKVELALREFVSNALDATNGDASQITVKVLDERNTPRASAKCTKVYIPCTEEGTEFVNDITKWFLQFGGKTWRNSAILEKPEASNARIYRRGVFVREVNTLSLFDYNLNDLELDEARISSDWNVKSHCGKAIRESNSPVIFARVLFGAKGLWESELDLQGTYEYLTELAQAARNNAWKEAQSLCVADNQVLVHENADDSLAIGKGYIPVRVPNAVYKAAVASGLRTQDTILTADEREGRKVDDETNPVVLDAVQHVWGKLEAIKQTHGEKFPTVKSFNQINAGAGVAFGVWKDNTVFINTCLVGGDTISPELFSTCLEELAHHITKCTDNSRGFQEFFIQVATKLLQGV